MMRILIYIFCLLIPVWSSAQNNPVTDGPYVFYKGDSVLVESIADGQVKKEKFKKGAPVVLQVTLPGSQGKTLLIPLKTSLEVPAPNYKKADNLLVLSDVEGNFDGFIKLLLAGGVIDADYNWIYGKGHLVICGDLFDRGDEVTASLWLLYKLEEEAKAKGGYVHIILGNHEIMNLSEDIRYVHPKYMYVASLLGKNYMELYAANTELGRWLRTKNIIEKIGKVLFLHAGVSPQMNEAGYSLKRINNLSRPFYDQDGYDSILLKEKVTIFFNSSTSPFWYRGYFMDPLATEAQVDKSLSLYNVKHIVVGHTIVENIKTLYNGKIIAIDVNHHEGNHQALLIENNCFYSLISNGEKTKIN